MEQWLRLANLQLSARTANALLDEYETPEAIFEAALKGIQGLTQSTLARVADPSFIPSNSQLDYIGLHNVQVVHRDSPDFPSNLKNIPDSPAILFQRGRIDEKDRFAVGLVGSRRATVYGRTIAARMARDLAISGLTVVSGGAMGIDTAAHNAAITAGGRTIAVLGCGLDYPYPKDNLPMFERIIQEDLGAVITEYPLGASPEAWRFPQRNRIISGLSMGVVVVEAGVQSGALITATYAGEQGREVMAVPGNVDRDSSRGTNALIRDGAILVENAQDVLRTLGILTLQSPKVSEKAQPALQMVNLPDSQQKLMANLSLSPKHVDALAADVHMTPMDVSVQMTLMELGGLVRRLPGNCYVRIL